MPLLPLISQGPLFRVDRRKALLIAFLLAAFGAWAADPPRIRASSVSRNPDGSVVFECDASGVEFQAVQVQSTRSLSGVIAWETLPQATLVEVTPGVFRVAVPPSAPANPVSFYRLSIPVPPPARLELNEVMSDNATAFPDSKRDYWDWIEIHNPGDTAVRLSGYGLRTDPSTPSAWVFPDQLLQPDAYLVVFASGLDLRVPGGELHADFRLSAGGEPLFLTGPDGSVVDRLDVPPLAADESYGRIPGEDGVWGVYAKANITPGKANSTTSSGPAIPPPAFPTGTQFYPAGTNLTLTLGSSAPGATIRFTLDGSPVSTGSPAYSVPLVLSSTVVVRARVFVGSRYSDEAFRTYFFGVTHDLPIVSLATAASNFDFRTGYLIGMGTAVLGANGQVLQSYPYSGSNAWKDREIEVALEFLETDHEAKFRQRVGMSVFGGWGSRGYPQKSYALFAREKYGKGSIEYRIFPDRDINRFESLVLRNSGNDNQSTHQTAPRPPITQFGATYSYGSYFVNGNFTLMRDALEQRLLVGTDLDTQAYRPAVLYINGEYWGIHNLREKIAEPYVLGNHGFARGEVDLIEAYGSVMAGDSAAYSAMRAFVAGKDLKQPANYSTVATQYLDLDNFIDYHLAVLYFQNFDIGNIKCWRPRVGDGRFRWIVYDQDYGFNLWPPDVYLPAMARDYADYDNMFRFYTAAVGSGTGWPNEGGRTLLLRRMLTNDSFKTRFIQRCADLLNTQFREERAVAFVESMAAVIRPEIPRHLERWSWTELRKRSYGAPYKPEYAPFTAATWETNLAVLVDFARRRPAKLRQDCTNYFGLKQGLARVEVDVVPAGAGWVRLNTATIEALPWSGTFFRDVPLTVAAIAAPGFRFVSWTSSGGTTNVLRWEAALPGPTNGFTARFEPVPGTPPEDPPVFITEFQYHPAPDAESGDWVELHNRGPDPVETTGWILRDGRDENTFVLPPSTIPADGYLVVCQDTIRFRHFFPAITNCVGNLRFGLNNGGDTLRLYKPDGTPVLHLDYDDTAPWPMEADGTGRTLQLLDPARFSTRPGGWQASPRAGGTPGRPNA